MSNLEKCCEMEEGHASDQTRSVRRAKKTEEGKLRLGVDVIAYSITRTR